MIGLIKKDVYLIIKSLKPIYLLPLLTPIFVITQRPELALPLISIVLSLGFSAFIAETIGADETAKWYKIVSAMPVSPVAEALSKFVLAFLFAVIDFIAISILGSALNCFGIADSNIILLFPVFGVVLVLLYSAITIPAAFKYGAEKSRYILIAVIFVVVSIPLLLSVLKINVDYVNIAIRLGLTRVIFTVCVAIVIVLSSSIVITTSIIKRRET
jgi:hypothetical protein